MSITIEGALVQESSAVGQNEGKINKETQLLNILSNTTQLYLEMLKINVELKKLPTKRAGVINTEITEVM